MSRLQALSSAPTSSLAPSWWKRVASLINSSAGSSEEDGAVPTFARAWHPIKLRFRDHKMQKDFVKTQEGHLNALLSAVMLFVATPLWALHCSRPWDLDLPPLFVFNSYWFYFCYVLPLYVYFILAVKRQSQSVSPTKGERDVSLSQAQKAVIVDALAGAIGSSNALTSGAALHDTNSRSDSSGASTTFQTELERRLRTYVPTGAAITASSLLLARCIDARICTPADSAFADTFRCNPTPTHMPTETALVVMIIPFFLQSMLKLTFAHACLLQCICWGTFLVCVCYLRDGNMGMWSVVISSCMIVLMAETEINAAAIYFKGTREVSLLAELSVSKQSQALFSQRTRLVRRVSHELRSPLFVMSSSLEGIDGLCQAQMAKQALTGGASFREIRELVSYCMISRETAIATLDELMLLDKVQSGLLEIRTSPVTLVPFVRTIFNTAKHSAYDKTFKYIFDDQTLLKSVLGQETTPVVEIDAFRIRQVLQNLLINAQKFTPANGTITVRLIRFTAESRRDKDREGSALSGQSGSTPAMGSNVTAISIAPDGEGGFVREFRTAPVGGVLIEVSDTGLGIHSSHLAQMFTEGYQISPEKTQSGGGTGYGLFICKTILEMHEGCDIWAESEGEGRGASFFMKIPILREADARDGDDTIGNVISGKATSAPSPAKDSDARAPEEAGGGDQSGGGKEVEPSLPAMAPSPSPSCILIVDDSLLVRKMLRRLLLGVWGDLEVLEAEDGMHALQIVDERRSQDKSIDGCIMDNQMPRLNGIETIRALHDRLYPGFIIGSTGNSTHDDFKAEGVDIILRKPYTADDLRNAVSKALQRD